MDEKNFKDDEDYIYADNLFLKGKFSESIFYFTKAANKNYPAACLMLSCILIVGDRGVQCDSKMSQFYLDKISDKLEWFTEKTKSQHPRDMLNLGLFYFYCKKNRSEAKFYIMRAADQGSVSAQFSAVALEERLDHRIKYLQSASKHKFSPATSTLGYYYEKGEGVEKNSKKAFQLYKKSSKNNDPVGLHNCAICFQNGIGTKPNTSKAFKYFFKSADQGFGPSQHWLALYYSSFTEPNDLRLAERYYQLACDSGVAFSKKNYIVGSGSSCLKVINVCVPILISKNRVNFPCELLYHVVFLILKTQINSYPEVVLHN